MTALLTVQDLEVAYRTRRGPVDAVRGISFDVQPGGLTALVGESGSGKSTAAQAIVGLLASNARISAGRIRLGGRGHETELIGLPERAWRDLRGRRIGLVPQDPGNSLNPVATIGASVAEPLRIHGWRDTRAIKTRVLELLERVGIDDPAARAAQYPHELSGGQRQRVLIAAAIALEPALIVADEPTSALDVTVQRTVLDLLDDLRRDTGAGLLLITHDLAVAADRADELVVMRNGVIEEKGAATRLLAAPEAEYTRRLLVDAPSLARVVDRPARPAGTNPPGAVPLVSVRSLRQVYGRGRAVAVDDVTFDIPTGTTHALVGESGSGKTTTGRAVAGLAQPTGGSVVVDGVELTARHSARDRRAYRRTAQLVYQNPFASLDPLQRIDRILEEPLRNFGIGTRAERRDAAAQALEQVALSPDLGSRTARQLSGGQRQRVAIARALILRPRLVILDEAVSALDVTVQAQILRLLAGLQAELGLTYLFISHDLAVVRQIADTVSVLQRGRQVEQGTVARVFDTPEHAYTRQLLDAIPGSRPRRRERDGAASDDRQAVVA